MKKLIYILLLIPLIIVGIYPFAMLIFDIPFELVAQKDSELQLDWLWNSAFFTHIIYGGVALLVGWVLFVNSIREKYIKLHRQLGRVYVISALFSAIAGIYLAFYANGGWIASLGFGMLGLLWFYFTLRAFTYIRGGNIVAHKNMMIYSYALCLTAVTFRIWNPVLSVVLEDQILAYQVASWESWLPNLFIAYLIIKNKSNKK